MRPAASKDEEHIGARLIAISQKTFDKGFSTLGTIVLHTDISRVNFTRSHLCSEGVL